MTRSSPVSSPGLDLSQSLRSGLAQLGLHITHQQEQQLLDYLALIQKWNQVYNLTALRQPQEMLTHHLLDSLAIIAPLRKHTQNAAARVLDVGSGAGLPGVVLAIVCPELDVTCVDTVSKKAAFIQQTAGSLRLPNLRGVHARVEALTAQPFDIVTSRAFASLADFINLTLFHVKPSGVWLAMKGKHPQDEINALAAQAKTANTANTEVFHVEPLQVPGLDAERCLIWLRAQSTSITPK